MSIYLYVKNHNKTGLKYFGKTTKSDPHKYTGSGVYWKRHLSKHGNDYTTEIIAKFDDEVQCQEFALNFSKQNDIVESNLWANLQEENGMDGSPKGHAGHKFTVEQLEKLSNISKTRWKDPQFRETMVEKQKESWTDRRREEQSKQRTGTKRPDHAEKLRGRKLNEGHPFLIGGKTDDHKHKISEALKGKPKSDQHKKNLSKPKTRVCRIFDHKEMSVNAYSCWLKSFLVNEILI